MLAGDEGAPGTPFTSGGTVAQPIEKADATTIAIGLLDIMRGIDSGTSERPAMLHESVAFNRLVERCSLSRQRTTQRQRHEPLGKSDSSAIPSGNVRRIRRSCALDFACDGDYACGCRMDATIAAAISSVTLNRSRPSLS